LGFEAHKKREERKGALAMARWPSKGLVHMYLYICVDSDKDARMSEVR
jgi:hypothetical protein